MQKLAELFDSILILTLSYPRTMLLLLVSPNRILNDDKSLLICPPGVGLAISFTLVSFVNHLESKIRTPTSVISLTPPDTFIAFAIIFLTITVLTQKSIITGLFKQKSENNDTLMDLKILSYPISVTMLVYSVAILLAIAFPDAARLIAPYFDSAAAEYSRVSVLMASSAISSNIAIPLYLITLFNVIRIRFDLSIRRSILINLVVIPLTALLLFVTVFTIAQIKTNIKALPTQEKEALEQVLEKDEK